jgi:hypothetical protein
MYLGEFDTYLLATILVIVIFTAGYRNGKQAQKRISADALMDKNIVVAAYHVGIKDSITLIDRKLVEFGKRNGIEMPAYEFTVNRLVIKNVKEIPRSKNQEVLKDANL